MRVRQIHRGPIGRPRQTVLRDRPIDDRLRQDAVLIEAIKRAGRICRRHVLHHRAGPEAPLTVATAVVKTHVGKREHRRGKLPAGHGQRLTIGCAVDACSVSETANSPVSHSPTPCRDDRTRGRPLSPAIPIQTARPTRAAGARSSAPECPPSRAPAPPHAIPGSCRPMRALAPPSTRSTGGCAAAFIASAPSARPAQRDRPGNAASGRRARR